METLLTNPNTLIIALLGWLIVEQRLMRRDVSDLRDRVSNLEGMVKGFSLFSQGSSGSSPLQIQKTMKQQVAEWMQ